MSEQPLKRDAALMPLSWQHQRGLRLARRIGLGEADVGDVERAWNTELEAHFSAEEELLFPFSEDAHAARVKDDHEWLRAMYERLRAHPDDAPLLTAFGAVLRAHIRFEERVWFDALQDALGKKRLEALHERMHARLPDAQNPPARPA